MVHYVGQRLYAAAINRVIAITLSVVVILTASVYSWYSDVSQVGFSDEVISFQTAQLDPDFSSTGELCYYHALSSWANALPHNMIDVQPGSESRFTQYYGNYSQLKILFPSLSTGNTGLSVYTYQNVGSVLYQGQMKSVNKVISGKACVVIRANTTVSQYKKTSLHEMGHLLGWFGHSGNSADVMYSYQSSVSVLTSRDKTQLQQIYALY